MKLNKFKLKITIAIALLSILLTTSLFSKESLKAADFKLDNIKGKQVSISDFNEKLIVLDFWATWCVPCKKAMKELDKIQKKYSENVQVIAISIDKPRAKSKAVSFVKSNRFSFLTLFDPSGRVKRKYNVINPPRTFIINPQKEIIYQHEGYKRGDEKKIEEIIKNWIEKQDSFKNIDKIKKNIEKPDTLNCEENQENTKINRKNETEIESGEIK